MGVFGAGLFHQPGGWSYVTLLGFTLFYLVLLTLCAIFCVRLYAIGPDLESAPTGFNDVRYTFGMFS